MQLQVNPKKLEVYLMAPPEWSKIHGEFGGKIKSILQFFFFLQNDFNSKRWDIWLQFVLFLKTCLSVRIVLHTNTAHRPIDKL